MGHGLVQVFTAAIASGTSSTPEIDFGRAFTRVCIDPTGASGSVMFQVAPNLAGTAGTYRYARHAVASGTSSPGTATVGSACSGSIVEVPALAGHRFVKVITDTTFTNGLTMKLLCSD